MDPAVPRAARSGRPGFSRVRRCPHPCGSMPRPGLWTASPPADQLVLGDAVPGKEACRVVVLDGIGQRSLGLLGQIRQSRYPEDVNHVLPGDFHGSDWPSRMSGSVDRLGCAIRRVPSALTGHPTGADPSVHFVKGSRTGWLRREPGCPWLVPYRLRRRGRMGCMRKPGNNRSSAKASVMPRYASRSNTSRHHRAVAERRACCQWGRALTSADALFGRHSVGLDDRHRARRPVGISALPGAGAVRGQARRRQAPLRPRTIGTARDPPGPWGRERIVRSGTRAAPALRRPVARAAAAP